MTRLSDSSYNLRWDDANIPIKLRGLGLDVYEPSHASGIKALQAAEDFVDHFGSHYVSPGRAKAGKLPEDRSRIGRGFLYTGVNGSRKTSLACAILTEVQYLHHGLKIFYIRFSDWKRYLTNTFTNEQTELVMKSREMLSKADQAHLLVLDDIGQEHRTSTGFTEKELHEFLRVRYEAARPTIVTSNIPVEFMVDTYGESFDSFRHDAFETFEFLGKDSRKIGK